MTSPLEQLRPDPVCPKCGETGFRDALPQYRVLRLSGVMGSMENDGWFEWTCLTCGFMVRTITADRLSKAASA